MVNNDGKVTMFGNIFDADGKETQTNTKLTLAGLGALESGQSVAEGGFAIYRKTLNTLTIETGLNGGDAYSFSIIVERLGETMEIVVNKEKCKGFTYEGIQYFLTDGDGDSFSAVKGNSFPFNIPTATDWLINYSQNYPTTSSYSTTTVWYNNEKPTLNVPTAIDMQNKSVTLSTNKFVYGDLEEDNILKWDLTVSLPAGESKFYLGARCRTRQVSYILTLKSIQTGKTRNVTGKWTQLFYISDNSVVWM